MLKAYPGMGPDMLDMLAKDHFVMHVGSGICVYSFEVLNPWGWNRQLI